MKTHDEPSLESNPYLVAQELANQIFRVWQQWSMQWVDGFWRNEQFLDVMGRSLQGSLQFKQQIDQLVEIAVANMQLPTKRDMEVTLHKLTELENLLHDLNTKMDRLLEEKQGS